MRSNHRRLAAPLGLAIALMAQAATADGHREHGAHVHGIGHLNVALDGATLDIELISPAANIAGFEHTPRDAAEQLALQQALALLHDGAALFTLPPQAQCRLVRAEVRSGLSEGDHVGEAHGHEEGAHHHADIASSYRFQCTAGSAPDHMVVNLFRLFPTTERLEVQFITPRGQRGGELTPKANRLSF